MANDFLHGTFSIHLTFYQNDNLWKGGLCLSNLKQEKLLTMYPHFLHPNEENYFKTLLHPKRQYSYLLGRYCAKHALAALTNLDDLTEIWIETGFFHQPIVIHPHLRNTQVSISHSNYVGASLAFSEAFPMGIDLEEVCVDKISIIETQVSLAEKKLCSSGNRLIGLTQLWTLKEALSKVLKCGLMVPFEIFEVEEMIEEGNITTSRFKNFKQYQAVSFLVNGTICSLVYPENTSFIIDVLALRKVLENINS